MKKYTPLFLLLVTAVLSGCGHDSTKETPTEELSGKTHLEESRKDKDTEEKRPEEKEPEDWYVKDGILYVNEIRYSIIGDHVIYEKPWSDYEGKINGLIVEADMVLNGTEREGNKIPTNLTAGPFADMDSITSADIKIHMNGLKDASFLLAACDNLVNANVFIDGDVEYAAYMFVNCKTLRTATVDISGYSRELQSMFEGCESLASVNMGITGTPSRCQSMFEGCFSLPYVQVSFPIGAETSFNDMFAFCDSLSAVYFNSVTVDRGGQAFFNSVNSIDSYEFANSWKINTENFANPIGEGISCTAIVPIDGKGSMAEIIIYDKPRPEWYREYMEEIHRLNSGFIRVKNSPEMDIYVHYVTQKCAEEFIDMGPEAMQSMLKDLYKEMLVKIGEKELGEAVPFVSSGLDFLKTFAEGDPESTIVSAAELMNSIEDFYNSLCEDE